MGRTPLTKVRTTHALTIKVNGITVGLINGWNATQGRTITPVFEVGTDDSGNPVELAPGNANGLTLSVSRYDAYIRRMEEAFGTPDLTMLTRQNEPFQVIEAWAIPNVQNRNNFVNQVNAGSVSRETLNLKIGDVSAFTDQERFIYEGCWFTNIGRTLRSDDNRIVNSNATLMYTKKQKISGAVGESLEFGFI
ncbi:hypothetical protein KAR91_60090 [Candidatus Pacearchaeota archaeon]|nr:hypothetical protein [Candidatus Pacearchaeota archaeon]